ncbi:hypothetical protein HRbin23_00940 [bacterium HR23]|nr:hypothetical protein HRbin23_00940 [bacterium HR23]
MALHPLAGLPVVGLRQGAVAHHYLPVEGVPPPPLQGVAEAPLSQGTGRQAGGREHGYREQDAYSRRQEEGPGVAEASGGEPEEQGEA